VNLINVSVIGYYHLVYPHPPQVGHGNAELPGLRPVPSQNVHSFFNLADLRPAPPQIRHGNAESPVLLPVPPQ